MSSQYLSNNINRTSSKKSSSKKSSSKKSSSRKKLSLFAKALKSKKHRRTTRYAKKNKK